MATHNPKYNDPLFLAVELVRCASITPKDEGAIDALQTALESLGFRCHRLAFSSTEGRQVENLYARLGNKSPNLCFAGHTDVVPTGNKKKWSFPPFGAEVIDGELLGRGASDMKGAIAAFVAASSRFLDKSGGKFDGSISFLITGDEEGSGKNGTIKVLGWMKENNQKMDLCLIGEPTNPNQLGEMLKIGRRGSLNVTITVEGKQGHAAYPERADNPVPGLLKILAALQAWHLDDGTSQFQPSNLEITNLNGGTGVFNVIPGSASAKFNIRYNPLHTSDSLIEKINDLTGKTGVRHTFDFLRISEAFLTDSTKIANIVKEAVVETLDMTPEFSTTGGSSDARFIKDHCPVVEFGLTGETIHAIDERARVADIENLAQVYERVLEKVFNIS